MKTLFAAAALAALSASPLAAQYNAATMPLAGEFIRSYLLENPEVVVEALQAYEQNRKTDQLNEMTAAVGAAHAELFNDPDSPVIGNAEGDVTVVEFADYRCGHCRNTNAALRSVLAADPGVKVIIKEWPILGAASQTAARYALAVNALHGAEAYHKVHDALYDAAGQFDSAWFRDHAAGQRYDFDELSLAMDSADVTAELAQTMRLAERIGITGTPFLVVGDEVVPGALGAEDFTTLIAQARQD